MLFSITVLLVLLALVSHGDIDSQGWSLLRAQEGSLIDDVVQSEYVLPLTQSHAPGIITKLVVNAKAWGVFLLALEAIESQITPATVEANCGHMATIADSWMLEKHELMFLGNRDLIVPTLQASIV